MSLCLPRVLGWSPHVISSLVREILRLPEGTLRSYCGAREASYIPDGACGPVCFRPAETCCWDVAAALGWRHIEMLRLSRFACTFSRFLARHVPYWCEDNIIVITIAEYLSVC